MKELTMRAICLVLFLVPSVALAQDPLPEPAPDEFTLPELTDPLPLRRGAAAPRDGLLVDAGEMLRISMEYDRLVYLLHRTEERAAATCDVRVEMERARLTACEERLRLRDELWEARQDELEDAVAEANVAARRAAERSWFESPVLWFVVGALATGVVWIAVAASP